jgi:amino acid efflux transporter
MRSNLKQSVGVVGLTAYYVSSIVGVGILVIPGIAANIAGPASLIAWVILLLISYPFALFFARMSMQCPDSSGIAAFVEKAFGATIGKTVAVALSVAMIVGNPIMGIATAHYLQNLFGFSGNNTLLWVGYGMMIVSILFNLLGLQLGSKVQTGILLLLIAGLLGVVLFAVPHVKPEQLTPFAPHGWWAVGTAIVLCFYSFLGWENVSTIAEEVKNPARTFPRAIGWAIAIVGVLYLSVSIAFLLVVPPEYMQGNVTVISGLLELISGTIASRIGDVIAVLLLILSTNAWVMGASRMIYALSRDGLLPKRLSRVHGKTGVPVQALLALIPGYAAVTVFLTSFGLSEVPLIHFVNSTFMIIYLIVFVAGLKLFTSRDIRVATWVSLLVTLGFLPFFREGMLFTMLLLGISFLLVRKIKYKGEKPKSVYS